MSATTDKAKNLLNDNFVELAENIQQYGMMKVINVVDKEKVSDQELEDFLAHIMNGIKMRDEIVGIVLESAIADTIRKETSRH